MNPEIETATPADAQAEQVNESVEQVSTEPATEQTQEQAVEPKEETAKKEPWFQKRINEQTRKYYEAERRAEQQAEETRFYREQLARVQQGESPEAFRSDPQTAVEQRAQQLVAERSFDEACNKVYAEGAKEFPNFDAAVGNLHLVGINRDFLELVATSDAGHKVLAHLGAEQNLDEAARIARLPPVQMARALTKLEFELSKPAPNKPVSNAPAPISPIAGTKGGSKSPEEMTDAEFNSWRRSQIAKRN